MFRYLYNRGGMELSQKILQVFQPITLARSSLCLDGFAITL